MAQAVSFQPLTADAWVRYRDGQCDFCGGHSGTGPGFSPRTSVSPVRAIPPMLLIYLQLNTTTMGRKGGQPILDNREQ